MKKFAKVEKTLLSHGYTLRKHTPKRSKKPKFRAKEMETGRSGPGVSRIYQWLELRGLPYPR